jgi:outer membrane protein, adhesin transport system
LLRLTTIAAMLAVSAPALAQTQPLPTQSQPLPVPSGRPMAIDFANDPVLGLSRTEGDFATFRALIAGVVERHPGTAESAANEDEALAGVEEAREAQLPTVDLSITSYRVIARDFSNDPTNIIERSRPEQRTDAI